MSDPLASEFLGRLLPSELHPGVSYRLLRPLGEGGMGIAFLAERETEAGRAPAVLKIVRPEVVASAGPTASLMVKKEAIALGRLNERVPPTPFVVRLLDVGSVVLGGLRPLELPWIAVEHVEGGVEGTTLEERVSHALRMTRFAFDAARAAHNIECLTEGLTAIHEAGVVHRDLSPGNILCSGFGAAEVPKIADFGIARPAGMSGTFGAVALGTPGYAAPEQAMASDAEVGPHTDVFSLACVTFFLLG
ncbi:MAG: serine/threonine protein kinase, partial [Deltaproteobacteria bacterium]|nr:serine/threonine protein kinase [Deltaproteobacteria bacterium]